MDFYVYLHRKKTNGEVFYVGKGSTTRAWSNAGRNELWKRIVNKYGYTVEIYLDNLQEWYAFELEQDLIALYGTIVDRTGPLSNMTGGGEGVSGVNHARYDRSEWTFYDYRTEETIKSTKMYFGNKFPEVYVASLFCGELSSKGWVVKELVTPDQIKALECGFTGEYSLNGDKQKYDFVFVKTGELVNKTRYEMLEIDSSINVSSLLIGTLKVSKGWSTKEVYDSTAPEVLLNPSAGINNGRADNSIYSFTNLVTGEVFEGTRWAFKEKIGFDPRDLFTERTNYAVKGWCLTERVKIAMERSGKDYNIYTFQHKDGTTFTGTRIDFKKKFGHSIKPLFAAKPLKTCKGWSLVSVN